MQIKLFIYRLKRWYHWLKTGLLNGLPAQIKTGWPNNKLTFIVITGTDGKTTTSSLIHHILTKAGKSAALISTVGARIGDTVQDTGFHVTSPDPSSLYKFLQRSLELGQKYIVLEMTSHGAYQYRMWGIKPTIVGYTNIAHEHFDYHINYDEYLQAKALIGKQAKTVVLNEDDQSYHRLRRQLKQAQIISFSRSQRLPKVLQHAISSRFPEIYNQMNARLAIEICSALGISDSDIAAAISSFPGVIGRMESISNSRGLDIVVDFAHTPQALEAALNTLRSKRKQQTRPGKIIAVYGSAGLRDTSKRPLMGEIGARLADHVILTAEDPRTEDVWSIIRQMKEQLTTNHDKIITIVDRRAAIDFAINQLAQKGDIIGIFGKGHEQSMCFGDTEYPWSDQQVVRELLKK